jgi:hypothetical protein
MRSNTPPVRSHCDRRKRTGSVHLRSAFLSANLEPVASPIFPYRQGTSSQPGTCQITKSKRYCTIEVRLSWKNESLAIWTAPPQRRPPNLPLPGTRLRMAQRVAGDDLWIVPMNSPHQAGSFLHRLFANWPASCWLRCGCVEPLIMGGRIGVPKPVHINSGAK